jgi:hypothetical protein
LWRQSSARLRGLRWPSSRAKPYGSFWRGCPLEPLPCSGAGLSDQVVNMTLMSEMPAGDSRDVIHHGGEVVAVIVPIAEYQQRRQALEEQRVNGEFDAARARYLARKAAGAIRYVSHEEARRRLGCLPGELPGCHSPSLSRRSREG